MMTLGKPLSAMTTDELMTRNVVAIPQDMNLQAAARLLVREQISGAPVIDAEGRCVGVLSANDFVRWADDQARVKPVYCLIPPCVCSDWQVVDLEMVSREAVRGHMTADPVTVSPATPVPHLARMMLDAHIHRAIVTDPERRPVGVVSSTDILAAVAAQEKPLDDGDLEIAW
jgi:CBS domain-containing protein